MSNERNAKVYWYKANFHRLLAKQAGTLAWLVLRFGWSSNRHMLSIRSRKFDLSDVQLARIISFGDLFFIKGGLFCTYFWYLKEDEGSRSQMSPRWIAWSENLYLGPPWPTCNFRSHVACVFSKVKLRMLIAFPVFKNGKIVYFVTFPHC